MVKAEIDGILAAEFCQGLLAPVNAAYADEKAGSGEKSDSGGIGRSDSESR